MKAQPDIITLALDSAEVAGKIYQLKGNYLRVIDASDAAALVTMRMDAPNAPGHPIRFNSKIQWHFEHLHFTWDAQPGKWIQILIGSRAIEFLDIENKVPIVPGHLKPKFAVVQANTNGDNTLIAAVPGKKIRVISGLLMAAGTVTLRFQSAAAGSYLSGSLPLVANAGFQIPYEPDGNFETDAGQLLNLELNAGVNVGGWLKYVEI